VFNVPAVRRNRWSSSKTECGHLNGGKSKAVTYAFPPGYRENAEEEEEGTEFQHEKEKEFQHVCVYVCVYIPHKDFLRNRTILVCICVDF
jgi:hypothetical protein